MEGMTLVIVIGLICFAAGAALTYLILNRRMQQLKSENIRLDATLSSERKSFEDKIQSMETTRAQIAQTFSALSNDALQKNNESFLKLALENLQQYQLQSKHELEKKEKSFENLVKPIKDALEKTEAQVREIEKERRQSFGALSKHLESMAETQQKLHGETRNLVQALRRPEVRGQWGEMTLRRLVELAGMVEHCDFFEQTTVNSHEGGRLRPDMIVRLPGGREVVVDIKTPLDAYLHAMEATDEQDKAQALQRHARQVRERMKELASKAYWQQFKDAPDFVVLFIPGEQFLSAALDVDRSLLEDALQNKVILSTPTSFVALLRAVAYGWRQEVLAENAEQIRTIGEELYARLAGFADHLGKLGKSLNQSVNHYNNAIGSFNSRVMPGARKFNELGINAKKEMPKNEPVDQMTRQVEFDVSD
jgi:DNA recombination protein RmuC